MNRRQAYYTIGRVLSLTWLPENGLDILRFFPEEKMGWNQIVETGSDNLVLPSFYLALEKENLLKHLPDDLSVYLKEIFLLNHERNNRILAESRMINRMLKRHGVHCVFMKGVANLLDGLYRDIGERMVLDIDIIVGENQMVGAAEILMKNGYYPVKRYNPRSLSSTMHYPLLIKEGMVAGVEIHRMPTQYLYTKALSTNDVLRESVTAGNDSNVLIMGHRHRIIHNFIHSQLMHNGHYHANVSLRDLYDLLLLGQTIESAEVFGNYRYFRNQTGAYLKLMHRVFNFPKGDYNTKPRGKSFFLWRHRQVLRIGSNTLRKYLLGFMIVQKYLILPVSITWNPIARNYVFSRLLDFQWYGNHFREMKRTVLRKE